MIKKISVIFLIIFSIALTQENTNDTNLNNTNNAAAVTEENTNNAPETNFFNAPIDNTNDANEPAILQDIRNIQNRAEVSNGWMFIRAIIGFIVTLVGIYLVFIYLKNKSKKVSGSSDIIKVLATTPVATNRYISIIEIVEDMYLVSISDHNVDMSDKTEEVNKIFNEENNTKLELTTYERNSILSNNLSISITYPDDNYVYIDRYKIKDGILKDWIKNQYEKEEYKQIMCPGIKEGTKQNGKWIYEGDESILIVDEYTYIAVDKTFVLDEAGWEKINQLIEL